MNFFAQHHFSLHNASHRRTPIIALDVLDFRIDNPHSGAAFRGGVVRCFPSPSLTIEIHPS